VIRNVLDRRLVSLVGEDGLGKSSVGAAVCAYLYEREKFRDAIVYFKAKGCTCYRQFLQVGVLESHKRRLFICLFICLSTPPPGAKSGLFTYTLTIF
jgi:ABC-type dipeptide/oligopeptide/nickel transport system ATPase component